LRVRTPDAAEIMKAGAEGLRPAALTPARRLSLHYAITRLLADGAALEEVAPIVLERICDTLGWDVGGLWTMHRETGRLMPVAQWHRPSDRLTPFELVSRSTTFEPGSGLPGRVVATQAPLWIPDVVADPQFPRAAAARASGLHAGFALPVLVHGEIVGVLEFFASTVLPLDRNVLDTVTPIAGQVAAFIDRLEAQAAIDALEAHRGGILAAALDGIISVDDRGRIVDFNPAAERIFGYAREAVIGQMMVDLIVPPTLRDAHRTGFRRYLETGDPVLLGRRIEITAVRADGTEFPVELALTRVELPGRPIFTGQVRDITERREAETARERFIDIVSHELRTPITAIYGGSKLLARRALKTEAREAILSDVIAEADRLQQLVEDLLVLIKSERGTDQTMVQPVLLHRLVNRVVEAELSRWPTAQIEVRSSGPAVPVLADETAVGQTLRNLLSNAAKYGPSGGRIEVVIEHGDDKVRVLVLDEGPGIRADEADRLFSIDYRSPLTSETTSGSGIGLFVSRWLIITMGGRIWAAPRPTGGAEFGFELPVVVEDDEDPG